MVVFKVACQCVCFSYDKQYACGPLLDVGIVCMFGLPFKGCMCRICDESRVSVRLGL